MRHSPVLLIAYNRPEKLLRLIQSLKLSQPAIVMIAVDGPRLDSKDDTVRVQLTRDAVEQVSWNCQLLTRFREKNLGLQKAYVDAVNWAISTYGRVTVIEDDVIAGPELVPYSLDALIRYENEQSIAQINGYNFVPRECLTEPNRRERLTKYPTSYTWSTWERAWKKFDVENEWGLEVSVSELSQVTGSRVSAVMWKTNFQNAANGRVNTWDYPWVAAMWKDRMRIVSPNRNLAIYGGFDDGTHTKSGRQHGQLEIDTVMNLPLGACTEIDRKADYWHSRHIFRETPVGMCEKLLASVYLEIMKHRRRK